MQACMWRLTHQHAVFYTDDRATLKAVLAYPRFPHRDVSSATTYAGKNGRVFAWQFTIPYALWTALTRLLGKGAVTVLDPETRNLEWPESEPEPAPAPIIPAPQAARVGNSTKVPATQPRLAPQPEPARQPVAKSAPAPTVRSVQPEGTGRARQGTAAKAEAKPLAVRSSKAVPPPVVEPPRATVPKRATAPAVKPSASATGKPSRHQAAAKTEKLEQASAPNAGRASRTSLGNVTPVPTPVPAPVLTAHPAPAKPRTVSKPPKERRSEEAQPTPPPSPKLRAKLLEPAGSAPLKNGGGSKPPQKPQEPPAAGRRSRRAAAAEAVPAPPTQSVRTTAPEPPPAPLPDEVITRGRSRARNVSQPTASQVAASPARLKGVGQNSGDARETSATPRPRSRRKEPVPA